MVVDRNRGCLLILAGLCFFWFGAVLAFAFWMRWL